jgi:ElaB/YqjD/DUF883 family membrane-anchored ribosome-binding protein
MSQGEGTTNPAPGAGEQLGEKLGEMRQTLQEMGQILKLLAEEKVRTLRSSTECCAGARAQCQKMTENVEECIRTQPLPSVLVAAGIGALLGAVCLRR